MAFCRCDQPLPEPDTASCVKCGHSSVAAIKVDPLDWELHRRRRNGFRLEGQPVELDCERDCWKHGGKMPCECEEGDDGTWHDGC